MIKDINLKETGKERKIIYEKENGWTFYNFYDVYHNWMQTTGRRDCREKE